jgi:hypothetical protein
VCGDGFVDAQTPVTEVCDDHNTSACGTCSAACGVSQTAHAAGSITVVGGGSMVDGQQFTLDDGIAGAGHTVVFEFDSNAAITGDVAITFTGGDTANAVRDATIAAIQGQATLAITATNGGAGLVSLAHDQTGAFGNQAITTVPAVGPAFTVTGMSGGQARDCAMGVPCSTGTDCASGICTGNVCQ